MEQHGSGFWKVKKGLCRHHQVARIAPEPGFRDTCGLGYDPSPLCHSEFGNECQGYESDYILMGIAGASEERQEDSVSHAPPPTEQKQLAGQ
jgi:hypothetical protein